ncbi:hypothetical protein EON67_08635, partial [archaeon]
MFACARSSVCATRHFFCARAASTRLQQNRTTSVRAPRRAARCALTPLPMSGFKRTRGVHTAVHAAGEVHGSAPFLDGDMLVDSDADDAVTTRLQPDIEAGACAPPASCKRARAREDVDETGRCDARTDGAWIDALPAGGGNSSSGGGLSRAGSQDMTPASAADAAHSRQEDVTTLAYAT